MAGLVLKYTAAQTLAGAKSSAVLVDLASYFVGDFLQRGPIKLAWSHPRASRQWFQLVEPLRWLLVEGNPDRFPEAGEPLSRWLEGRWGSYRGVEVSWEDFNGPALVTAFVDPLASRPLYYFSDGEDLIIADKLATITANQKNGEIDWIAVLEAMLCGSVYSGGVSLKHTIALRPGEAVRFLGPKYHDSATRLIPDDPEFSEELVHSNPAKALQKAMVKSVTDIWREVDPHLLLTGGLDSRFLLALGGRGRRAVHVTLYPEETKLAQEIAAAGDCQFSEFCLTEGHYLRVIDRAYLLTGAMFDSRFAWQLGLGATWNDSGVTGTLNGYLFDTLLKGYFFVPYQRYPYRDSILFSLLGPLAHPLRERMSRFSRNASDMVLDLLSPEARELGMSQLRRLPDIFPQVVIDGIDVSFERMVLSNISRQVHYPLLLGWFEETQAYTPAFHPALWSWYTASSTADRLHGRALRQALASMNHPVCRIPDANTGLAIDNLPKPSLSHRLRLRNNFVFSHLRDFLRPERPKDNQSNRTVVGRDMRMPKGQKLIQEWIERTRKHPIFDPNGLDRAWNAFQAGDDRAGEALLVMIGARQWEEMIKHRNATYRSENAAVGYTRTF